MKIMQLGKAVVYDAPVFAWRCQRGACPHGAVFVIDYPDCERPDQLMRACTDHLSDACRVINEDRLRATAQSSSSPHANDDG